MRITVPTELKDISLDQVQRTLLIQENEDIDFFARKVHIVSIMTGKTPSEVALIKYSDLDKIYNSIERMICGLGDAPLTRVVKYLGREYGFIEDVRDLETGAFIDIDEMSKGDKYAANLHKIMAVLYRPIDAKIGDSYRLKSYVNESQADREERQAIFLKHMTMDIVRGATGFFLPAIRKSLDITGDLYPVRGVIRKATAEIPTVGVGTTSFTP
jgi:hypothetical protein